MPKLNQIIAIEKGVKVSANTAITATYHRIQKPNLFDGIVKTYEAHAEDGDQLPGERQLVQQTVPGCITEIQAAMERLWDLTVTKDVANQSAKADIVVNGTIFAKNVPVSTLLFLEKQLVDLHTFVTKLPLVNPEIQWSWDSDSQVYRSDTVKTVRNKKVPRNHVKAAATEKHPAQVEVYYEDVVVGTWSTTRLSGATTPAIQRAYLVRIEALQKAVKQARETANLAEVTDVSIANGLLNYVFSG